MGLENDTNSPNAGASQDASGGSHDEFWGGIVVSMLALGVFLALGFFAFLGYRAYERHSENSVSITDMAKGDGMKASEQNETQDTPEPPATATDAKQATLSVLNGGGAKGSAGVLADFLRKEGYAKISAGNADGDYSGVTVFYQEGQESAAKAVLADVVKKYPKAVVSSADPKRKETGSSPISVIIGK